MHEDGMETAHQGLPVQRAGIPADIQWLHFGNKNIGGEPVRPLEKRTFLVESVMIV